MTRSSNSRSASRRLPRSAGDRRDEGAAELGEGDGDAGLAVLGEADEGGDVRRARVSWRLPASPLQAVRPRSSSARTRGDGSPSVSVDRDGGTFAVFGVVDDQRDEAVEERRVFVRFGDTVGVDAVVVDPAVRAAFGVDRRPAHDVAVVTLNDFAAGYRGCRSTIWPAAVWARQYR